LAAYEQTERAPSICRGNCNVHRLQQHGSAAKVSGWGNWSATTNKERRRRERETEKKKNDLEPKVRGWGDRAPQMGRGKRERETNGEKKEGKRKTTTGKKWE
jgi:hypothetical protein